MCKGRALPREAFLGTVAWDALGGFGFRKLAQLRANHFLPGSFHPDVCQLVLPWFPFSRSLRGETRRRVGRGLEVGSVEAPKGRQAEASAVTSLQDRGTGPWVE